MVHDSLRVHVCEVLRVHVCEVLRVHVCEVLRVHVCEVLRFTRDFSVQAFFVLQTALLNGVGTYHV